MVVGWVKELVEEIMGGPPFSVGDVVKHPSGRTVKIVSGQYWGTDGLSNFWYWREISSDGSLSDAIECGYGWGPDDPPRSIHSCPVYTVTG